MWRVYHELDYRDENSKEQPSEPLWSFPAANYGAQAEFGAGRGAYGRNVEALVDKLLQ